MLSRRIDRLIYVKNMRKEKKEEELHSLLETLRNTEDRIQRTKEEYRRIILGLEDSVLEGPAFHTVKEYLLSLEMREKELNLEKRLLESKIREVKDELFEIYKDLKKLETLKKKVLSFQKKEDSKRLQKLLDELAIRKRDRTL